MTRSNAPGQRPRVMAAAVPRFRNWNVTITCDNGTSTQATTYF